PPPRAAVSSEVPARACPRSGGEVGAPPRAQAARAAEALSARLERAPGAHKGSGPDLMPGPLRAQDPLDGRDSARRRRKNATAIAALALAADRLECVSSDSDRAPP